MPYLESPKFKEVPLKMFEIPQPAIGGINLRDLEFEQDVSQSPKMMNVMYRNGAMGKRYGQDVYAQYDDVVYATAYFNNNVFVHSGAKIYKDSTAIKTGLPTAKGLFITYEQKLYYLISSGFYVYNGTTFDTVTYYVPDFMINCKPDGSDGADVIDDLNILGEYFNLIYNGDGSTTVYHVEEYDTEKLIDWTTSSNLVDMDIEVDGSVWTQVAPSATLGTKEYKVLTDLNGVHTIEFSYRPDDGDMNVIMKFKIKASAFSTEKANVLGSKYFETYGGAQNSRLFLAGNGKSKYYFSASYDITYFPEDNWATLGNTEEDISGFGKQYNVLIIFKPREIYSLHSYTETSSTTVIEENIGKENFKSQLVNARIGCDAPYSIQLVNNLLVWYNSNEGMCTLVSTNIQDERNVRIISRNIDRTNNMGVVGILDIGETPTNIQSADFENKYFIVFPSKGICFMWDYEITPYVYTSRGETDPKKLSWFLFDKFYVKQFLRAGKKLLYVSNVNVDVPSDVFLGDAVDYMADYNFSTTDGWFTYGGAQFSVSDNVAYVTVEKAGDGFGTEFYVPSGNYYLTFEFKNPSDETIADIPPTGNDFERFADARTIDGLFGLGFILTEDLSAPVTLQARNIHLLNRSELPDDYTIQQLNDYFDGLTPKPSIIELNSTFHDLDFDADGRRDTVSSYYMTPFMQFNAVEYLKNVKEMFVQCRGDTNSLINVSYYTNDSDAPELDPEEVRVNGGKILWKNFKWSNFRWGMNIFGKTFRRKCNLKKIEMVSVIFENNEVDTDMSVTHMGLKYSIVKEVR